jgi:hypothetical protein
MDKRSGMMAIAVALVCTAGVANAQDYKVAGQSDQILLAQNTSTQSADKVAVTGISTPVAYWGYGGKFSGGYIGVQGLAQVAGGGSRYGGWFNASGGTNNYAVYGYAPGTTDYAGYFVGNVYVSGTFTNPSDMRLKLNIRDMPSALSLVLQLRPRLYQFRTAEFPQLSLPEGEQMGLVAQEVQGLFPQLVKEVTTPEGRDRSPGMKILSVDYSKLIPVLVKAIQEQQAEIDELKALIGKK